MLQTRTWCSALLTLALAVLASACTSPDATQLVVVLRSDMVIPDELDEIRIELFDGEQNVVEAQSFALGDGAGRHRLPASFGIAPQDGDIDRPVHLRVSARVSEAERFHTEVLTGFVSGQVLRLEVFLARRCVEDAPICPEGQTCRRDGCVPVAVDETSLPPFESGDERDDAGVDAGYDAGPMDAGPMDAGAVDAGRDAGLDAGPVDAGRDAGLDAGPVDAGRDAGFDAGRMDAGRDAGLDAGLDAGVDAGAFDGGGATLVVPIPATTCTEPPGCGAGAQCRADFGGPLLCHRNCRSESECSVVGAGSLCDASDHCTQPCNVFTDEGCPAGSTCGLSLTSSPPAYAPVMHVTVCRSQTTGAFDGALCDDTGIGGHADCAAEYYCVSGRCRQVCRVGGSDCLVGTCMPLILVESGERGLIVSGEGEIGRCM